MKIERKHVPATIEYKIIMTDEECSKLYKIVDDDSKSYDTEFKESLIVLLSERSLN